MHIKNEINRLLNMTLKRFIKYFFIIAIFIVLSIPLIITSYSLAKESIIKNYDIRINEGMKNLESQIKRKIEIANILKTEKAYKKLLLVKDVPLNSEYTYLSDLQEIIAELTLTQESVVESHLLFRDNPIFISNYISSDNYESVYPSLINYENISAKEWHEKAFDNSSESVLILPTFKYYSKYYSSEYFDAFTILINNSQSILYNKDVVFATIYNTNDIINSLVFESDIKENICYIVNEENDVILSNNYAYKKGLTNIESLENITIDSNKYIIIKSDSMDFGLTAYVGIPTRIFDNNVNSLINVVLFSSILAIILAIIFSFIFSMKETISIKKIIDLIDKSSTLKIDTKNEYNYLNYGITQLNQDNKEKIYQIKSLDKLIKSRMLENAFNHGIYNEVEENNIYEYFDTTFEYFCVVICRIESKKYQNTEATKPTNSIYQNTLQKIESSLESILKNNYFGVNTNLDELSLVILLNPMDNTDLSSIKEGFIELINIISNDNSSICLLNIGMSRISSGIRYIREGYIQARDVINYNEVIYDSNISIYETPRNIHHKKTIDYAILSNCYDSIIIGDEKAVEKIFESIINSLSNHNNLEREKLQLFYSIRQPLYNAFLEITKDEEIDNNLLIPPNFNYNIPLINLIYLLKEFSIDLCHLRQSKKNNDKENIRIKLMKCIEENFANINLSACIIATNMGLSEKYIFSLVKENTNTTLSKLIEEVRITKAEEFLLTTDYSNSKIACLCGFGSDNTFYRAFAKKHSVTPSIFKTNNIKRNNT